MFMSYRGVYEFATVFCDSPSQKLERKYLFDYLYSLI
jgi:hypothetical protein